MDKFEILKTYFGHSSFREGQAEIVDSIMENRDAMGIMPTGAGKSVCYQVPSLMKDGISIVISPLISLMKDQVNSLIQSGISAAYINSSLNENQYRQVLARAYSGQYKIIYVAPERLESQSFFKLCTSMPISMVTVDEAHCVSQWGQDFRPSYLKINGFMEKLETRPPLCAFTATATEKVKEDIVSILKLQEPKIVTTGFDRKNLYFEVRRPKNKAETLLGLISRRSDVSGIVYCSTRKGVEGVCDELTAHGYNATRYHAGLDDEERLKNQDDFLYDRKTIMVATNAFGMGIDKSNVSYVIHYNMPKNIESYYQEAGRAGRDGSEAECILLYSPKDVRTNEFFIENPNENEELTEEMREEIKKRDYERLKAMTFYCTSGDCLRHYMLRYFGENSPNYCGKCGSCDMNYEDVDITVDAQKIISCVWRIQKKHRSFGKTMIVDILRGSNNEKVRKSGCTELPTYGIMKERSSKNVYMILDYLIEKGYLGLKRIDGAGGSAFYVIALTQKSSDIVIDKKRIVAKLPKEEGIVSAHTEDKSMNDDEKKLFEILRQIRSKKAEALGVPAFVVFSDSTLRDISRKKPVTKDEFLEISGVGKMKADRYGKIFTDAVKRYINPI